MQGRTNAPLQRPSCLAPIGAPLVPPLNLQLAALNAASDHGSSSAPDASQGPRAAAAPSAPVDPRLVCSDPLVCWKLLL